MAENRLILKTIVSEMFAENAYVAHLSERDDCVIVDPSFDYESVVEYVEAEARHPAAILNTHGHVDHIAGNAALKKRWPECPLVIGAGDASMLTNPMENLSGQYAFPIISPEADQLLKEGDCYECAGFNFQVRETPGHSPGHIVFIWDLAQPTLVFGGDVLFHRGIGRTDFPGCSFEQLRNSIHNRLFTLPDDAIVLPGHGNPTTIGEEKQDNPFVGLHLST